MHHRPGERLVIAGRFRQRDYPRQLFFKKLGPYHRGTCLRCRNRVENRVQTGQSASVFDCRPSMTNPRPSTLHPLIRASHGDWQRFGSKAIGPHWNKAAVGWARRLDWLRPTERPKPHHKGGSRTAEMARLEAVLLVARQPLSSRRIAQLARLADGTQARTLIRRLQRCYDEEQTAFRVEEFAGGFQLLTRPKFGGWLRRLGAGSGEGRLSSPALETLAVVAYRQPVVRADIEAIRGVGCGEILRQLMDRDLVKIVGRANELGRPFLYGTTRRFLQVFGLQNLDALPRASELRRTNQTVARIPLSAEDETIAE
jgi:segregation and condensation protein B